jgi:hypothetical protein
MRHCDERFRPRIGERGPGAADQLAKPVGEPLGSENRRDDLQHDPRPSPEYGEHSGDDDPDRTVGTDEGEPLEDRIQPADAVVNDPPLEVPVETQTGRSCLVEAISC